MGYDDIVNDRLSRPEPQSQSLIPKMEAFQNGAPSRFAPVSFSAINLLVVISFIYLLRVPDKGVVDVIYTYCQPESAKLRLLCLKP
jgi:hypothetical protein